MLWTTSGDTIDDCVKDVSANDEKEEGIFLFYLIFYVNLCIVL